MENKSQVEISAEWVLSEFYCWYGLNSETATTEEMINAHKEHNNGQICVFHGEELTRKQYLTAIEAAYLSTRGIDEW